MKGRVLNKPTNKRLCSSTRPEVTQHHGNVPTFGNQTIFVPSVIMSSKIM